MDLGLGRIKVVKLWALPTEEVPHLPELLDRPQSSQIAAKANLMRDGFPLSDHFGNPGTWVDENSLV